MSHPHREPTRLLYVSYDGLLEPLGRSQVLSYLTALSDDGHEIAILSFEKRSDLKKRGRRESLEAELEARRIPWRPLVYHRHPRVFATLWDVVRGITAGLSMARRHQPDIVHARSYVAGVIGLGLTTVSGARFLFDMRGFWPEERVEMGLGRSQGFVYRASKHVERWLLTRSNHVVVLTENAKAILRDREAKASLASSRSEEKPITVIPCCVDPERFTPMPADLELARAFGLEGSLVVGNIGAFSPRYLTYEMFRFAFHLRAHRPGLRFVYLTGHDPEPVRRVARDAGLKDGEVLVLRAEPEDVPRWLSLIRLGIFFLRPSYAAKGSCFTKLGEFLSAGVPVATNTGVGDVDRILGSSPCGILLPGLTDRDLQIHAAKALALLEGDRTPEAMRNACRATALQHFALADGVRRYRGIYDSLSGEGQLADKRAAVLDVS